MELVLVLTSENGPRSGHLLVNAQVRMRVQLNSQATT